MFMEYLPEAFYLKIYSGIIQAQHKKRINAKRIVQLQSQWSAMMYKKSNMKNRNFEY